MIKAVLKRRAAAGGHKPPKKAPSEPEPAEDQAELRPQPARARSSRVSAAAKKRYAELSADEASASPSEEEAPPPRAVRTSPGKRQKATVSKGEPKGSRRRATKRPLPRLPVSSSSEDEDVPLGRRVRAAMAADSSEDDV